jgi:multiple sugar transport system permease protein
MSILKIVILVICIFLAILSLFPFIIMLVNATRSTYQIQQHPISLIPSKYLMNNFKILTGKSFNPAVGFLNSFLVSVGVCICSLYFSTLTAYAIVMYEWKLKNAFFGFIMGVMMIPSTVTIIGFFQMIYRVHMTNHLLVLILPAIASPSMVFFMRQYMKPAVATQAIFTFVTSWNELFRPSVILTKQAKYTLPIMVGLLNGDIYKREHGAIYVGLSLTALPLIIVYFLLAKYIVAGVALGSVKG